MYSPRRSYGSPPPELSNNPFIDHPSNALARYPDISGIEQSSTPYTSWTQLGSTPSNLSATTATGGYGQQMGYGGVGGGPSYQQQPQATGWSGGYQQSQQPQQPQSPYGNGSMFMQQQQMQPQSTGRPFQPSSSFGQQLAGQVNGYQPQVQPQQPQPQSQQQQYTGYPSQYSGYSQAQPTGYNPVQAQQQTAQYLSEFDPYSQQARPQSQYLSSQTPGPAGGSPYRPPHPREYVRDHKLELEAWDPYAWKQVENCFDALKEAWGVRKRELEGRLRSMGGAGLFGGAPAGYGGYGGPGQEIARLEQLAKEADSNFDSVAASTFQMQEVHKGYRQSGDLASKRRVRESINAALSSLPDWPSQNY